MMKGEEKRVEAAPKPGSLCGVRHLIVFLLFLSTTVAYATRVSMSMAIVAMTDLETDNGFPTFDWSQSTKDMILSSFFWGYVVLQIPAGMLAARLGGKWLMFVAMLVNGVVNIFVPVAATHGGWVAVIVCRVLMGLSQGLLYPSAHGSLLGTIMELMLAGSLSESAWGWPAVFYVAAAMCLAWASLWLLLGASTPADSRHISSEERDYIQSNNGSAHTSYQKNLPTPWKKIWTSLPFWAILIAHSGQSLGFWTLLTEIPTYMKNVLGVDMKQNGLLSALPYAAMYVLSFVFSWAADLLTNRNLCSVGTTRKIFNTIAFWGPAASLLALSYLPGGDLTLAVLILTLTVGLNGAHYVGFLIAHIDIAPNFSSTLMGITNGCGNIFSILAPLSVSFVISDETSAAEWRKVFFISVAFYFLGNLFFLLFASGRVQDWNQPQQTHDFIEGGEEAPTSTTKDNMTQEHKF